MITFKEYLQEQTIKKWDVKQTSLDEIIKLLNAQYTDGLKAISNGSVLYRGWGGGAKEGAGYKVINTTSAYRLSRDTNNLYQLCMDNSSALADYPKRSNSLICCTRSQVAKQYGNINAIIPANGTKVAACKTPDIFETLIRCSIYSNDANVDEFSNDFAEVLNREFIDNESGVYNNIDVLNKALAKAKPSRIAGALDEYGFNYNALLRLFKSCPEDKRMTAIASAVFSPKSMSLALYTFGDVLPTNGKGEHGPGNEAWFSGKAVAIDLFTFASIILKLQELGHPVHPTILKDLAGQISSLRKLK